MESLEITDTSCAILLKLVGLLEGCKIFVGTLEGCKVLVGALGAVEVFMTEVEGTVEAPRNDKHGEFKGNQGM